MKTILFTNVGLLALLVFGAGLTDYTLELGQYHGAAFRLYLLYGSIVLFVLNLVAGGVLYWKQYKEYATWTVLCGAGAAAVGVVIAYFV